MTNRWIAPAWLLGLLAFVGSGLAQEPSVIDEATRATLDAPVTLNFPEATPLDQILDAVKEATKNPGGKSLLIEVDRLALKKAKLDASPKVKIVVNGVPLKSALTQVVRQSKLTYVVKGARVTITVDPFKETDPKDLEARMKREDSTVYAPKYSEDKFHTIKVGMAEGYVHTLIGKPIRESRSRPQIDWYYGPPSLRVTDDGGLFDSAGEFDPDRGFTVARAHPDGKIFETLGGYFENVPDDLVGQPLEEFKKRYGEPVAIHVTKATRYLIYSGPRASGSFRTRAIGVDSQGKVVDVISGYEFE